MLEYKDFTSFLIRIAFVLGNLTTYYDEARKKLGKNANAIHKLLDMFVFCFIKDEGS